MVILYNQMQRGSSPTTIKKSAVKKSYKSIHTKNMFSKHSDVRQLTKKNKTFLQSLGLKVLV